MVIESQSMYDDMLRHIAGKEVYAVAIRDDFRTHPAESIPIIFSISCETKIYDIVFNHSESMSNNLDFTLLSCAKRFYVEDIKQFYHLTKFKNIYDVKLNCWINDKQFKEIELPKVFSHIYSNAPVNRESNKIVPLFKVLEYSRNKLANVLFHCNSLGVSKPFLKYNDALIQLAIVESNGLRITPGSYHTTFKNGYAFSNYNIHTVTGRPSNTFNNINFGALNKSDGTRTAFISRHKNGMLIEMDYDAYHLRLLADILDWDFPKHKSVHQYFADEVYHCEYKEAKKLSFQMLYGQIQTTAERNPFFYGVDRLSQVLLDSFTSDKCLKSHIYGKEFCLKNVEDLNRSKLLNYFIQSFETERNLNVIKSVNKFLKTKRTKMTLYTYDSFLFDFDINEGLNTLKELKALLESGGYPIKAKAGQTYHDMNDITGRL